MIAAQRYHKRWAEANGLEVYPVPTDVACAALQDRMDSTVWSCHRPSVSVNEEDARALRWALDCTWTALFS